MTPKHGDMLHWMHRITFMCHYMSMQTRGSPGTGRGRGGRGEPTAPPMPGVRGGRGFEISVDAHSPALQFQALEKVEALGVNKGDGTMRGVTRKVLRGPIVNTAGKGGVGGLIGNPLPLHPFQCPSPFSMSRQHWRCFMRLCRFSSGMLQLTSRRPRMPGITPANRC